MIRSLPLIRTVLAKMNPATSGSAEKLHSRSRGKHVAEYVKQPGDSQTEIHQTSRTQAGTHMRHPEPRGPFASPIVEDEMLGLGIAGCEARIGGAAAQAFTVAGGDHLAPPESIYQAQGDNGWSEDGRRMIEEALPARGEEMSRWKLRKQIEELEKENRGLLATMNQMRQEMQALADENRRSTAEIEKLQGRVEHQARNLAETRALAYEFGSTANSVSGADIRGMMQGLNSEIFQTAASLSCSLHFRSPPTKFTCVTPAPELFQRMTRILGPIIVDFILTDQRSKTGSSMLVQIALQAALTHWGCDTINSRLLGGDDTINSFIHELYRGIRHSESSAAAGRWRVMTQAQLITKAMPNIRKMLLEQIIDVLVLANWRTAESLNWKALEAEFGQQLDSITQRVVGLNRDIGTKLVSDDLEAGLIPPGCTFHPLIMEKAYPDDEAERESELVLCTTGLGVWTRACDKRRSDSEVVLKAQVLLPADLEQLIR
ncbi:hypothetical protein C8J57DRAFT_1714369, partial [Mycena rebaudengoi]